MCFLHVSFSYFSFSLQEKQGYRHCPFKGRSFFGSFVARRCQGVGECDRWPCSSGSSNGLLIRSTSQPCFWLIGWSGGDWGVGWLGGVDLFFFDNKLFWILKTWKSDKLGWMLWSVVGRMERLCSSFGVDEDHDDHDKRLKQQQKTAARLQALEKSLKAAEARIKWEILRRLHHLFREIPWFIGFLLFKKKQTQLQQKSRFLSICQAGLKLLRFTSLTKNPELHGELLCAKAQAVLKHKHRIGQQGLVVDVVVRIAGWSRWIISQMVFSYTYVKDAYDNPGSQPPFKKTRVASVWMMIDPYFQTNVS